MKLAWDSAHRVDKHDGGYHRVSSDPLYHTPRWTKLSKRFRTLHPLCAECGRKGIIREGQCVDHIIPWPVCSDFFDESNLQTLCNQCNMEKGIKDRPLITKWKLEHGEGAKNL